ncbi:hypothetical protein [Sediminibacterium soli]|uniref:hypothetical protein n=1 Tax=Sediminibacterium soli TaxID=2698829 RepID=UPI001379F96E|nr:hypothetical protein [Sediminibacterium soli]NCI46550.1 hypothetical protein [Sediminibacterium soli]
MHKPGRQPVKKDERTFRLADYLRKNKLPAVPDSWNWDAHIAKDAWGEMDNMRSSDCTIAAAGHFIMTWTSNTGKLFRPSDAAIVATYSALTGYDPETGANDIGMNSIDVLKYWRKYYIHGHRIFAFASIDPLDHEEVRQTIYLFGGCYAGLNLPASCMKQKRWEIPASGTVGDFEPGSWGGHAVLITGYSEHGLKAVTWGIEKWMSWAYFDTYCDEAYAVLSEDFIKDNKNPAGIDLSALRDSLAALKNP